MINMKLKSTITFTTEQTKHLGELYRRTLHEMQKAGADDETLQTYSFQDFVRHHTPAYFFEHIEENAKMELQEYFKVSDAEIGNYERTGKLPFPETPIKG